MWFQIRSTQKALFKMLFWAWVMIIWSLHLVLQPSPSSHLHYCNYRANAALPPSLRLEAHCRDAALRMHVIKHVVPADWYSWCWLSWFLWNAGPLMACCVYLYVYEIRLWGFLICSFAGKTLYKGDLLRISYKQAFFSTRLAHKKALKGNQWERANKYS